MYDIAIIGAGLVGETLACHLDTHGFSTVLIDAKEKSPDDSRFIALNAGSCFFLNKLLPSSCLGIPIKEVHVSHKGRFGSTRIRAKELKLNELGHVIPANELNHALEKKLSTSNVHILRSSLVSQLKEEDDHVCLTIKKHSEETTIQSKLVIAADGTHSTIRSLLEIPTEEHDYQQSALVTRVQLTRSHHHIAYERFLKKGAIAMLPLSQDQCAVIWSGPSDAIRTLYDLHEEDFLISLQKEFGHRLGFFTSIEKRSIFPLKFIYVKNRVKGRVFLIGNAAHTIHPLAAQGLNIAFKEIEKLTEQLLIDAANADAFKNLNHYSFSEKMTIYMSHYLNNLFTIDFLPMNILRQLGMIGLDMCNPIKRKWMEYPAGVSGIQ